MDTMTQKTLAAPAIPLLPHEPLKIQVTDLGQDHVALRSLVRQAIPMLTTPERYPAHERRQLAQSLSAALELSDPGEERVPIPTDAEAPPDEEQDYEPGCSLDCCENCRGCN